MSFSIDKTEFVVSEEIINSNEFNIQSTPHSYKVCWDNSENPCELINQKLALNPNNILLIDEKVYGLYKNNIIHHPDQVCMISAFESSKTIEGAIEVFDFLYKRNFSKADTLIVVGGGITQDIGAFVGLTYKRGIKWVFFPTTLLAMSDSCIGGKAGLNFKEAKNQLAVFSAPKEVIINPRFIETLDEKDVKSGLGEILKLFITGGSSILNKYEQYVKNGQLVNVSNYRQLILMALAVKKSVIEQDEFESYERKALNYGHTFGHVIETLTNYQIPHGIAVVLGIVLVNQIGFDIGCLNQVQLDLVKGYCLDLLDESVLNSLKKLTACEILNYVKQDKKVLADSITLVLLENIGQIKFFSIKMDDLLTNKIQKALQTLY